MTKKIMFSDKYRLTQAVLEGRKTQTRRILNHQPSSKDSEMLFYIFDDERYYDNPEKDPLWGSVSWKNSDGTETEINKVAYLIGEEVAVAQSYDDIYMEKNAPCPIPDEYRLNAYNKGFNQGHKGWKNKMFVLPDDMPFRIKITNVRVEFLNKRNKQKNRNL